MGQHAERHARPRWRDRWRAVMFHTMATVATTVTLGVLGGLAVVGVMVLGVTDGNAVLVDDAPISETAPISDDTPVRPGATPGATQLLAVVPVMVITGTGLGLTAGVLSAPWGRRRPADWTRPTIAGLLGAFHLAGVLERARIERAPIGTAEVGLSIAVALALWAAIALATVLGAHRGAAPAPPSGRAWRESVGAAVLFALTVTYLAVSA